SCAQFAASAYDYLVPVRAHGDVGYLAAHRLLAVFDIGLGGLRQVGEGPAAGYVAVKAGQILVHRLGPLQRPTAGEVVRAHSVHLVVGADGDIPVAGEHVQLGEGELRRALHPHAVAAGHDVKAADAPRAAGGRAVLA